MTQEDRLRVLIDETVRIRRRYLSPPVKATSIILGDGTAAGAAALLQPNIEQTFGEVLGNRFGGAVVFASVASTSKSIEMTFLLDKTARHTAYGADLVDGGYTVAHSPGVIVMTNSPGTPLFVFATSTGDTLGIPFAGDIRFLVKNVGASSAYILKTFVRIIENID